MVVIWMLTGCSLIADAPHHDQSIMLTFPLPVNMYRKQQTLHIASEARLNANWCLQDMNAGGIQCIAFSRTSPSLSVKASDGDETTQIPDFTISTDQGTILSIAAATFNDPKAR